jgi:hypothetical protein
MVYHVINRGGDKPDPSPFLCARLFAATVDLLPRPRGIAGLLDVRRQLLVCFSDNYVFR